MDVHDCNLPFKISPTVNHFIDSGIFIRWRRRLTEMCMISTEHPLTEVYYKSSSSRRREEQRHLANYQYTIHPFSVFALRWEYLVSIVYSAMFVLLSIISAYRVDTLRVELLYFKFALNMFLTADILKIFFTGYYDSRRSKTMMRSQSIAWQYLRTYFLVDVMANFHGYVLPFYFAWPSNALLSQLMGYSALFMGLWIFRLPRWLAALGMFLMKHNLSSFVAKGIRAMLVFIMFVLWLFALIFIVENFVDRFLAQIVNWKHNPIRRFFAATLRLFVVTYDSTSPKHIAQVIIAVVFMSVGYCLQLFIYAQVMQVWKRFESAKSTNDSLYQQFEEYMKYKGLPMELRNRFFTFFEFKFQNQFYNESKIGKTISPILNQEILLYITKSHIEHVDFFRELPASVLQNLVAHLKTEIYLPGDTIISAGVAGNCMYLIYYGTVAIYSPMGREICHLEDGAHFGEIALIFREPRTATVVAITACELFILDKQDFNQVLQPYPDIYNKILRMATDRLRTSKGTV